MSLEPLRSSQTADSQSATQPACAAFPQEDVVDLSEDTGDDTGDESAESDDDYRPGGATSADTASATWGNRGRGSKRRRHRGHRAVKRHLPAAAERSFSEAGPSDEQAKESITSWYPSSPLGKEGYALHGIQSVERIAEKTYRTTYTAYKILGLEAENTQCEEYQWNFVLTRKDDGTWKVNKGPGLPDIYVPDKETGELPPAEDGSLTTPVDLDTGGKKKKQKKDPDAVYMATLSSEQSTLFLHQRMVAAAPELETGELPPAEDGSLTTPGSMEETSLTQSYNGDAEVHNEHDMCTDITDLKEELLRPQEGNARLAEELNEERVSKARYIEMSETQIAELKTKLSAAESTVKSFAAGVTTADLDKTHAQQELRECQQKIERMESDQAATEARVLSEAEGTRQAQAQLQELQAATTFAKSTAAKATEAMDAYKAELALCRESTQTNQADMKMRGERILEQHAKVAQSIRNSSDAALAAKQAELDEAQREMKMREERVLEQHDKVLQSTRNSSDAALAAKQAELDEAQREMKMRGERILEQHAEVVQSTRNSSDAALAAKQAELDEAQNELQEKVQAELVLVEAAKTEAKGKPSFFGRLLGRQ